MYKSKLIINSCFNYLQLFQNDIFFSHQREKKKRQTGFYIQTMYLEEKKKDKDKFFLMSFLKLF